MFEIGDKVVYGVVGVCEVENIDTPPIKGISGDYYFLQPVFDSKGIIYSPVDSNKVMIRSIMTVKECDKLKERARNCKKDGELSEKVTSMQYDEHMKSQDALKLMHLIRALYVIKNERAKDLRTKRRAARFVNAPGRTAGERPTCSSCSRACMPGLRRRHTTARSGLIRSASMLGCRMPDARSTSCAARIRPSPW